MGFKHASFFITSIWFSKLNYNQVNQALLLWRYFDNSFGTSSFSTNSFFFPFSFIQTQVYTLSLKGDVSVYVGLVPHW
jgi:hypothetical protein